MSTLESTYNSLDELTVWVFYEIMKTSDYSLLGPEGDENLWYKLYDEYYEKMGIKMLDFKVIHKLQGMIVKHKYITLLLNILETDKANRSSCKVALKKMSYRYDENKSLNDNLKKFESSLDVLFTKIEIVSQEIPEEASEYKNDIWDEVVALKSHFKVHIDPKTTVCSEWISLKKQMVKDVKASRLINNKRSERRAKSRH